MLLLLTLCTVMPSFYIQILYRQPSDSLTLRLEKFSSDAVCAFSCYEAVLMPLTQVFAPVFKVEINVTELNLCSGL